MILSRNLSRNPSRNPQYRHASCHAAIRDGHYPSKGGVLSRIPNRRPTP
jgi:hypothetical protein